MPYITNATYTGQLVVSSCWKCGIHYGVPEDFRRRRQDDKGTFYCPNGHGAVFTTSTEEQLRRELKWANDSLASERAAHEQAAKSLSATRGVVTRMKRRAMAGACPFGCHRTFRDLQRHIVSKHPNDTTETAGE